MRRGLGLAVLLLVLLAPDVEAQGFRSLTGQAAPPAAVKPGTTGNGTLRVDWCYQTTGAIQRTIEVSASSAESWLTVAVNPASFPAPTGQNGCNVREVAVTYTMGREALAFKSSTVTFEMSGAGTTETTTTIVQADYWAEVEVQAGQVPKVPRGDLGMLNLQAVVRANEGTRLEVIDAQPSGKVTVASKIVDTQAGRGLDQPSTTPVQLQLTASPGADLGAHNLQLRFIPRYALRPDIEGEARTVTAHVEVVAGSGGGTPGFEAAFLLLGAVGALLVARRVRR